MRYAPRLQFGSIATILLVSAGGAAADPGHKTPKECNSELYSRLAAIKAAGETPARFVHDCWWHSQPGQPTAILRPGATPPEAPREAKAAPPPSRQPAPARVAAAHHGATAHRVATLRHAGPRLADVRRRRDDRVAEARRLERLTRRVARVVRAARARLASAPHAAPHAVARALSRLRVASYEIAHRRSRRERLAEPIRRPPTPGWGERPIPADVATAAADLGPTARAGRRMWVQVVAADKVSVKPAVAVGGLAERASAGALNCWGQPVLLVGHDAGHWSREMVCDGKPAGANEWSATIYYGGPAAR